MLDKEFEMWPADPISNMIFVTLEIYVTNLGYLKDELFCIIELPDSNTKESNMVEGLDKAATIPNNNDKYLLDLSDLKAK